MATSLASVIAVNRFGLGARPDELSRAQSDPRGWLGEQIAGVRSLPDLIAALPSSADVFKEFANANVDRIEARATLRPGQPGNANQGAQAQQLALNIRQILAPKYQQQVAARYHVAGKTAEPLRERLTHFWTNHFAVSSDKMAVLGLVGGLENEAIRSNIGGRFANMLLAVERHPAMLLYLDNQQSTGPNSQLALAAGRRNNANGGGRKIDINENLAREILELHTLGVNGGYTQTDVTTFAQALTGWSIGGGRGPLASGEPGRFIFREQLHEPGAKTVLGKRYSEDGEAQAKAVLEDLARRPATAKFIATKLVRHFVNDEPPPAAVEKIAQVFLASDGHLPTVHRAVIELPQAWSEPFAKFKTPHEFVVSTFRALDFVPQQPNQIASPFELLGQRPYTPGSPAGWPDTASHWDGSDALMKRIEWATAVGQKMDGRAEPRTLAERVLGSSLGDHTRTAIARAASVAQALTLLLVSPEFQRR